MQGMPHQKGFGTEICNFLSPKGIKSMAPNLGLREKTHSNSDEDSSGNNSLTNNPFYPIWEEDEEDEQHDNSETTQVLAVAQIEEQEQSVLHLCMHILMNQLAIYMN